MVQNRVMEQDSSTQRSAVRRSFGAGVGSSAGAEVRLMSLVFSWLSDLLEKLKELVTIPDQPVLVPIPVRNWPPRPQPGDRRRR